MRTERAANAIGVRGTALVGLLWLMPLPLASNRIWLVDLWLVGVLALALAEIWSDKAALRRGWWRGVPRGLRAHMALMLAWVLLVALQLVPLPLALRNALAGTAGPALPVVHDGFAPLSIDPYATSGYLAKAVLLLLVQWLLLRRFDNRPRLAKLVWSWLAIGAAEALAAVVLYATASTYMLFFVTVYQGLHGTGTFVYHNQFAGYMELMLALGIGWMIALLGRDAVADRRGGAVGALFAVLRLLNSSKAPLRVLLVLFVVGLIISRSRMGNAAFFVALWLVGSALLFALHRRGAAAARVAKAVAVLMISIFVIDVAIVGDVVGIDKVMQRIERTHLSNRPAAPGAARPVHREQSVDQRIAPGMSALGMLRDHPLFGTGGGTFFLGFMPYRPSNVTGYYQHAHDDYVEFLVENGIIGVIPLVALLLWSQRRGWSLLLARDASGFERGLAFASVMGVTELLLHATVDFNLQNPTNAMLFLWLLALPHWLDARRQRRAARTGEDRKRSFCNNQAQMMCGRDSAGANDHGVVGV